MGAASSAPTWPQSAASAASVNALRLNLQMRRKLGHGVQLNLKVLVRGDTSS